MANAEHVERLKVGVNTWNRWRKQNPRSLPNLFDADLKGANLFGADLSHAYLRGTYLMGANLGSADLRGAYLIESCLNRVDLRGADLSHACFQDTSFGSSNLSHVKGLDLCNHYGPSSLDPHTLNLSGRLPSVFLRGCGYLNWQIEAAKLHQKELSQQQIIDITYRIANLKTDDPIQYQSCFISYSGKDEPFCRKLHDTLQDRGVRCWFSPEHIRWGEKLRPQLDEAIQQQDRLLLVLTETSLQSPWVVYELRRAKVREEREQRRILFPLRLIPFEMLREWKCFDNNTGKDLAEEVREYFIPDDFTNWEDDAAFAAAFERLLANLRQERRDGDAEAAGSGGVRRLRTFTGAGER